MKIRTCKTVLNGLKKSPTGMCHIRNKALTKWQFDVVHKMITWSDDFFMMMTFAPNSSWPRQRWFYATAWRAWCKTRLVYARQHVTTLRTFFIWFGESFTNRWVKNEVLWNGQYDPEAKIWYILMSKDMWNLEFIPWNFTSS